MEGGFKKLIENKKLLGVIIIVVIVLVWGALNSKFSFDKYDPTGDMRGQYDVSPIFVKNSLRNFHQFPLWIPYVYGGTPFFQYPQYPIFNIANLLVVVLPSFNMAINLLGMIQLLIIGISMYFLLLELGLDYKYAMISAFTFMFNRYNQEFLVSGGELHFDSIVWLPTVILFILRAYKKKEWIKNSIFAGIFFALAFHAGDVSVFTYMLFFVGLFFFYLLFINLKRCKKIILVFIIFVSILFGLMAIRLFPLMDFSKVTDLGSGRSFESAKGYFIQSDNAIDLIAKIVKELTTEQGLKDSNDITIGLFTFILALLSLPLIKNKYVLFFVIAIIILSNVATGSSIFYLLWKFFPGFNRQHHIIRVMLLIPFCFSILAGFGSEFLFRRISSKIKNKKMLNIGFLMFIVMLFLTFPYKPPSHNSRNFVRINMEEQMNSNPLMVYLKDAAKEEGLFRIHRWDLFNHIGGGGQSIYIPMGISTIHGQLNTFEVKYLFEFINPIAASNPTKILGIYNTRYFYFDKLINSSDLVLIKEFKRCDKSTNPICDENFGPYLYLNQLFVPRLYIVDNTILVIGEKQNAINAMYALILNDNFSPANLAIVPMGINDINKHNIDFFLRFNAIILLNRPEEGDLSVLKQYVDLNGKLLPNIFKGESSLTQEQINLLLKDYSFDYNQIKKIEIIDYKPNSMKIRLNNQIGFVVIAEKYFMYEGWHTNDKRDILRANGFSSGVFINQNDKEIEFNYFPKSFKIGTTISSITLLFIVSYFMFRFIKKKQLPKDIKIV